MRISITLVVLGSLMVLQAVCFGIFRIMGGTI